MSKFLHQFFKCLPLLKNIKPLCIIVVSFFLVILSNPALALLKTSAGSGNWGTSSTWLPSGVPAAGDDVIIAAGHNVSINVTTGALSSLTVTGTLRFNSTTDRILNVAGNIIVLGVFTVSNAGGNNSHTINLQGNLIVSGTLSLNAGVGSNDFCNTNFNGNTALQTITGAGTKSFNTITINKGTLLSNVLDVQSVITITNGGLTIINGTFKLSSSSSITPFTANTTIPATGGFWNNGGTVTTTGGNIILNGLFRNTTGVFTVGNAINNSLNASASTADVIIEGGNINVAGRMVFTAFANYTQTSGTVLVSDIGNSSSSIASFDFAGAAFTMSGGTIVLQQAATVLLDYSNYPATQSITGGVLQVGDASSVSLFTYYIQGDMPGLSITSAGSPKNTFAYDDITVNGNMVINAGSGLFCYNPNTLAGTSTIFKGVSFLNNGSITGDKTNSFFGFYGTVAQSYSGSGTFGTLAQPFRTGAVEIANANNVTLSASIFATRFNLLYGTFINSNQITIGDGAAGLVQRGGAAGFNAGSFDVYPTYNAGSNYVIRYDNANAAITGFEVPATRIADSVYINNASSVSLSGGNITIVKDIQLVQGVFNLGANSLIAEKTIIKLAGVINGASGSLVMKGNAVQIIPSGIFIGNNLKNLTISNTAATVPQVSLADSLNITGTLSFGNVNNKTLSTAGFLTLKSTAAATARVADLTNAGLNSLNIITGNVSVERFINSGRKWRFLSVPTNSPTQTFRDCWQENGTFPADKGFLVGDVNANWSANSFDRYSPGGPSVKTYNSLTDTWVGITKTTDPIKSTAGYMCFIQGGRTTDFPSTSATTIRTKGLLYQGTQTAISVPANKTVSVGNPFASPVNMVTLLDMANAGTNGLIDAYQVWDSKATGVYGFGGYQVMAWNGSYFEVFPGGGSYGPALSQQDNVESGQAFFIKGDATGGTISFKEKDKAMTATPTYFTTGQPQRLRAMLHIVPAAGAPVLADGTMAYFDENYTNNIDENDMLKIPNTGENVSLLTDNTLSIIEKRHAPADNDSLIINLGNLRVRNYQWELILDNMDYAGRTAFLVDKYTGSNTVLNMTGTTFIDFNVQNIAGSYAANRFVIVFKQLAVLPVNITSIIASRDIDKTINVNWKSENEINIHDYVVEKSNDARIFLPLALTLPENNNGGRAQYNITDNDANSNNLFYRIKATSISGQVQYSAIVKLDGIKAKTFVTIYPNPVTGKKLNLRFSGAVAGSYLLSLSNAAAQMIYKGSVQVNNTAAVNAVQLPANIPAGFYQLLLTGPDGNTYNQQVIIQ